MCVRCKYILYLQVCSHWIHGTQNPIYPYIKNTTHRIHLKIQYNNIKYERHKN